MNEQQAEIERLRAELETVRGLLAEGRWLLRTLVERLHLPPEQALGQVLQALERLYVQYPTGEVLDGGPAEYTLAADNGRHMSEIARDALKDGDA